MKLLHNYLFVGLCLLLCIGNVQANSGNKIELRHYSMTSQSPTQLLLTARFDYKLTNYLRQALLNGVTLRSSIYFNLVWHNEWWWDRTRRLHSIDMELRYHALSRHYQLVNLDTKEHWNFTSLNSALGHMGYYTDYKLPAIPSNATNGNAYIFMQAYMEPKSPNLPLKLRSLFSSEYRITSQGVVWTIP